MSTVRLLAGILFRRRLKGQIVTSELGMIKLGLLILIAIGVIIIFLFLSGYLDKVIEWISGFFGGHTTGGGGGFGGRSASG